MYYIYILVVNKQLRFWVRLVMVISRLGVHPRQHIGNEVSFAFQLNNIKLQLHKCVDSAVQHWGSVFGSKEPNQRSMISKESKLPHHRKW
jgi:hypothetical protein